jgi:hypothetical protein
MTVRPGDTVEFDASGTWYNLKVGMRDTNVTWAVTGDIGTVDEDGSFTAGPGTGSGTITATAGGKTVTISVEVKWEHPFTDVSGHWSEDYVAQLYALGLTNGTVQADGTFVYKPNGKLTRGELLVFISRMLDIDVDLYQNVTLPFADNDTIPSWMLNQVKALYAVGIFKGSSAANGTLYANVNSTITREQAMTMLGRILYKQTSGDLSGFLDSGKVSSWAKTYVETLVAEGVINGSNGYLNPGGYITRGEAAKILVLVNQLPLGLRASNS